MRYQLSALVIGLLFFSINPHVYATTFTPLSEKTSETLITDTLETEKITQANLSTTTNQTITRNSSVNTNENVLKMFLGLAGIVILIFIVIWMLKKAGYQGYSANNLIKMKSCLPLSPKEKLLLVEIGGEQILIGTAPGFVGHIKTLKSPVDDIEITQNHSAFSEKLKSMMIKKEIS